MRRFAAAVVLLLLGVSSHAQSRPTTTPSSSGTELPVKRVVLYKNGVGYFEHEGRVAGSQEVNVQFTTGQLNDVLKSLTVVDLGGGKITGVRYNSIAPLSERLGTLRIRLGEHTTRTDFLNALRGARVEVRNGAVSAVGKLLSVELSTRQLGKDEIIQVPQVAVVTEAGELRTFDLTPATSVRIMEGDLNQEVGRYLNLIGSSRAKDLRRMTISTTGNGSRDVFVSYISEVPVWKSTYRIVLPKDPKNKPLLQGWAIVDNTIGEDWKDVQLSLVAGAPQSFVQQISQPLYVRRPTVDLPETAQLTPQTHEETMQEATEHPAPPPPPVMSGSGGAIGSGSGGGVGPGVAGGIGGGSFRISGGGSFLSGTVVDPVGAVVPGVTVTAVNTATGERKQAITDSTGRYSMQASQGQNRISFEHSGFQTIVYNLNLGSLPTPLNATLQLGSVSETIEVAGPSSVDASSNSANTYLTRRSAGITADAEGRAMGDLFEYALQQKITVLKNQSALVPIIQSPITAERVTLWNSSDEEPLRALWVTNSSGLTLDAGTFNIIEGDAFAGEGLIAELHPNERRLLSYAADTAIRIDSDNEIDSEPYTKVSIIKGLMKLTREERDVTTYSIRNSDTQSRDVVIEHPAQEGWKLAAALKPEESTSSFHRFRVKVDPGKTAELKVVESKPQETQYVISNLNDELMAMFVKDKALNPEMEQALRRVLAKKAEITAAQQSALWRRQEINRISQEQNRLRENMKALKGTTEEKALLQRYVKQLNQQEDQLAALNKEMNDWESKRSQLSTELDQIIQEIAFDDKL